MAQAALPSALLWQKRWAGTCRVPEVLAHRQQYVRGDLQGEHAALGVDAHEDGDDQLLVPAADADAQEVPPLLGAFLVASTA